MQNGISIIGKGWNAMMEDIMNISDVLLSFRDTQDVTILRINQKNVNIEELNVIAIEILLWLRLDYKRTLWQAEGKKTTNQPLHLNMQYSWCKYLKGLLEFNNVFSDVFFLRDGNLGFRDEVDEDYRSCARKSAYYKYNPQKII